MAVFLILSLVVVPASFAEKGMRGKMGDGMGPGDPYARTYNPASVETLNGEVVEVDKMTPKGRRGEGIHLDFKTEAETITVHLGPAWFLEKKGMNIEKSDQLEIKGSRVALDGNPTLIAAEIKKEGNTLTLRDANGIPFWSARREGS